MLKRRNSSEIQPSQSKRPRGNIKEENVEEDSMFDMSQRPDFTTNSMGKEAETGIIEQVLLKNFMCHTRLDFKFCPQVNFVIGRNGSGKSAILTALVVGLGGKASTTNRGTSIKGFIKHGKQKAEVMIKLRNRGSDAYKHDEYGDSIIIERTFTADGGSAYKLKSHDGRMISHKREELTHIVDQFNIQVDNPVAILNQDTSRNFLHSKSPADKYKFFLKATQLEQMKHEYARANEQKVITTDIIKQKEETIPNLKQEVYELEQKYKALASLDDLREKVAKLKKEMAWAFVYEKEKELEPLTKSLRTEELRTPKFIHKVDESQAKVDDATRRHKEYQEKLKALGEEVQKLQPQHDAAKKGLAEKKKICRAVQMELSKLQHEHRNACKDRSQIEERIAELKSSVKQDDEAEKRAIKIQQLSDQLETYKAQQMTTEHQNEQFRLAVNRCKEESYRVKAEEQEIKSRRDRLNGQIKNYQDAKSNALKRFGNWTPELLNRIDGACRQGRFHQRPRGPLGNNIKLNDPCWALAIESCLKQLCNAFCCNDHHDEKILESIIKGVLPPGKQAPTIVTSKFKDRAHDVSQNRVHTDAYPTVLDMLTIDDPVVSNCLIDQRTIENILLIKVSEEARKLMSRNPPRNCREAFTIDGDQMYCTPTFRYYSASQDKSYLLKSNVEEDIRSCQEELRRLNVESERKKKKVPTATLR